MTNVDDYCCHMDRRRLSPNTVRVRRIILTVIEATVGPLLAADTATLQSAIDARNLQPSSVRSYASHLRAFYAWAILDGRRDDNPAVALIRPQLDQYLPRPMATGDLDTAITAARGRVRVWLVLAAFAGLRCCEIAGLTADGIDVDRRTIRVLGKGRKEREVPMHDRIASELDRYLLPLTGPIFRRTDGGVVSARRVSDTLAYHLRSNGIDATAHQARHWFATETYDRCLDLRVVQEMLGHASPVTTSRYVRASADRARAAVAAL